jgi:hypothetical protein
MILVGARNQQAPARLYKADLTLSGSAQLLLAESVSRSYLFIQNTSATHAMSVEFGSAQAHCAITNGAVSSVTIDNGGFNFTSAPLVYFQGGGPAPGQYSGPYKGLNQPNGPAPTHIALGHATLSGGAVNAVVIDDPGATYQIAPYVLIVNNIALDPYGAATPSASSGYQLAAGTSLTFNGTFCPTDSISIIGTAADVVICRWAE